MAVGTAAGLYDGLCDGNGVGAYDGNGVGVSVAAPAEEQLAMAVMAAMSRIPVALSAGPLEKIKQKNPAHDTENFSPALVWPVCHVCENFATKTGKLQRRRKT